MKKYLLLLLLPFIFLNNVKAEECNNLLDLDNANWLVSNDYRSSNFKLYYSLDGSNISYIDSLDSSFNKTYTFFIKNNSDSFDNYLNLFDLSISQIRFKPQSSAYTADLSLSSYTFKQSSYNSNNILSLEFYSKTGTLENLKSLLESGDIVPYLVEGSEICSFSVEPDDPVTPSPSDNPITDFYSIYLDKLTLLSNYSLENKYLLSFVSILVLFIFLELLFVLLPRKRGRK